MTITLTPLVSFLVPAYNHENYITECLDSIRDDDYPNKELIIFDDGSTDSTKVKIENWIIQNQSAIRTTFISQENVGLSKTLNRLIHKAKGEFIRLIASDDCIVPASTKIMLNAFDMNPQALCIFGDCRVIDATSKLLYGSSMENLYGVDKEKYLTQMSLGREIIFKWAVSGPSTMIRKCTYEQVGYYDESLRIEDWDMFLRILKVKGLVFIPQTVSSYRIHSENASRFNTRKVRIANLNQMKIIALKNIDNFSQPEQQYLTIQLSLINAKIYYLEKHFFRSLRQLSKYLYNKSKILLCGN